MKSLVNMDHKHDSVVFALVFALIACIFSPVMLYGQGSEIEILGPSKTPFSLILRDTTYASNKKNRLVTAPLAPGLTALYIRFHDTRIPELHDTILLIPGNRHVMRLRAVNQDPVDSNTTLGGYLKSKSPVIVGDVQVSYNLTPLETTPASEYALTLFQTQKHDTGMQVSHAPAMVFTRDTLVRAPVTKPETPEEVKETAPATNTPRPARGETLSAQQLRQLKNKMKDQRFEEDRLRSVNGAIGKKQLSADQLLEILMMFDFERSKMQLFKQYFGQLSDQANHPQLYKAFEFGSTIDELKAWVYEQSE